MVQSILDAQRRKKFNSISAYYDALSKFTSNNNENKNNEKADGFEFTKSANPLIDEYFEYVAATGQTSLSWDVVRSAFIWKLQTVMNDMHLNEIEIENDHICKEELVKKPSIEASKTFVLEKAKSFDGIPFTIQRLCELITTPTRHYRVTEKYLHALEKNINVVTTVTETGERITGVDDFTMDDCESPLPIEQNFIVSVDELDAPITTNGIETNNLLVGQTSISVTTNGFQKNTKENQTEENTLI